MEDAIIDGRMLGLSPQFLKRLHDTIHSQHSPAQDEEIAQKTSNQARIRPGSQCLTSTQNGDDESKQRSENSQETISATPLGRDRSGVTKGIDR